MTVIRAETEPPAFRYVVYGHRLDGSDEVFHVGSGERRRAASTVRSVPWLDHVAGRDVSIVWLGGSDCPARARLMEATEIATRHPVTNFHHRNGPNPGVLAGHTKRGQRCDCDAPDCYGREVAARRTATRSPGPAAPRR